MPFSWNIPGFTDGRARAVDEALPPVVEWAALVVAVADASVVSAAVDSAAVVVDSAAAVVDATSVVDAAAVVDTSVDDGAAVVEVGFSARAAKPPALSPWAVELGAADEEDPESESESESEPPELPSTL